MLRRLNSFPSLPEQDLSRLRILPGRCSRPPAPTTTCPFLPVRQGSHAVCPLLRRTFAASQTSTCVSVKASAAEAPWRVLLTHYEPPSSIMTTDCVGHAIGSSPSAGIPL